MAEPYIPQYITVHLGPPASSAQNVTVTFPDYIKNVASSEIYPTWPESALRANIYVQISFALNRFYTEWYPSQGTILILPIPLPTINPLWQAGTSLKISARLWTISSTITSSGKAV